ncbi:MAG: ABC transporter substrate-binding protein [Propionibacteriaceae bacterium]|nr:ABC transporter substrate-binding protein [Propionibacteriaceae bacterium]
MKKKLLALGVAAALSLSLAACTTPEEGTNGDTLIKVGFSQIGSESGWRTANTDSVKASLSKDNGFELTFADAMGKQENQIKALRDFITAGVDVISFTPIVETGWDQVLQEIKDAGIPVVLVDRLVDTTVEDPYVTWVGADFRLEGQLAGQWVKENYPDAKIFELQGQLGSGAQIERELGFHEYMAANIIGQATGNFNREDGKVAMEAALAKYPDMNLLFAHNDDMGLGAIEAIKAAGKVPGVDIIIVTVDGVKAGLEALLEGEINYIVECNPVFGDQIADLIKKVYADEPVNKENIVVDATFEHGTFTQEELDQRKY